MDLRRPNFSVASVEHADVIHASSKEIKRIFKLHQQVEGASDTDLLILTKTEELKAKWMKAFTSLHQKFAISPSPNDFLCDELVNRTLLDDVKSIDCAARAGTRLLLGTVSGLFVVSRGKISPVGDLKKVSRIESTLKQASFVLSSTVKGKYSQLTLFGINAALRGRDHGVKINESKGVNMFTVRDADERTCLVFAVRNRIILCELQPEQYTCTRSFDIQEPPRVLQILEGFLFIGHNDKSFSFCDWTGGQRASILNESDETLKFIQRSPSSPEKDFKPLAVFINKDPKEKKSDFQMSQQEFILCYNYLAVFVDSSGNRKRPLELKWSSKAHSVKFFFPYLVVGCDHFLEVINIRDGSLHEVIAVESLVSLSLQDNLYFSSGVGFSRLIYLREFNADIEAWSFSENAVGESESKEKKGRYFPFAKKKNTSSQLPSKIISAPSGFQHVSHLGQAEVGGNELRTSTSASEILSMMRSITPESAENRGRSVSLLIMIIIF